MQYLRGVWFMPRPATPNQGRVNILANHLLALFRQRLGVKCELGDQYFGVVQESGLQTKR
jgi:hypothetical protein